MEPLDADSYRQLWINEKDYKMNEEYVGYLADAGAVRTSTCAPYLTGWIPLKGQHFITTESSNVLLCNSLFGACGNPEGIEASFWAAICGRTPKYGRHVAENRIGTCRVYVDCPINTHTEWELLGYVVGSIAPKSSVPVLIGSFDDLDLDKFKHFSAPLAVVSDIDMCHVLGITPEAPTLEAAFGSMAAADASPSFHIVQRDIDEARAKFCSPASGKVGSVNLGCPHYSIYEIKDAAMALKGKKVAPWVHLHIWTTYSVKAQADRCGFTKLIEAAGGNLLAGSCPCYVFEYPETKEKLIGERLGVVFDSIKLSYCMPPCYDKSINTYFGEPMKCLAAALDGFWR